VPCIDFAALSVCCDCVYVVSMAHRLVGYQPRAAEHGVLYRVIDEHLETFLEVAAQHADGHRLPKFVEQEFRDFLTCGVLAHGFARLRWRPRTPGAALSLSVAPARCARAAAADGRCRILLTLKAAWADGTRHLVFAPMELLEKLAALTPRPRINLILYHGVLGPNARWRARVVAYGAPLRDHGEAANLEGDSDDEVASPSLSRRWAWANLMRRAFDVDVLVCRAAVASPLAWHYRRSGRHSRNP
jgi:hypothetical protein